MATALYNIFIMPLELFIELVFSVTNTVFNNPGFAIIFVSIAVQLLCFPLYKRADDIQTEDREKQKEMKPWLDHIKKTFKGDERFMMQQNYYRICGYKPIYAVKGSISLLLQIPFFIAAYNFLSNLNLLKGTAFLGISDLSQPDLLIHIGGITLNLLPILMTFFNVISGIIYLRGLPLKDKIQTYGLAVLFLIILYRSPSGLVFYWTLNNLFSLLKNVFLKIIKNPRKVVDVIGVCAGIGCFIYFLFLNKVEFHISKPLFLCMVALVSIIFMIPAILSAIKKNKPDIKNRTPRNFDVKTINAVFYFSATALFILIALLIPVQVVKSSPTEFISVNYGPYGLIFRVACIVAGLIFVWLNIFYLLGTPKNKKVFSICLSSLTICCIVNYFFFGKNLGLISTFFVYDEYPYFPIKQVILNLLIIIVLASAFILFYFKKVHLIKKFYQIISLTMAVLVIVGSISINGILADEGHPERKKTEIVTDWKNEKKIHLSKNGKNVIVFMLDRAIGGYLPYIFDGNPELKEIFDGFTYYPNTISFGGSTNYGSPALFGGYEYTPIEMNKRVQEKLESKHNEALTVLPKLFADNNYNVYVYDPPLAGYKWSNDVSIYDRYEDIYAENLTGKYSEEYKKANASYFESTQTRNFVFYGIMRAIPIVTQSLVYQNGGYWSTQPWTSSTAFFNSYTVLEKLNTLTDVSGNNHNNFIMMQNSTTHEPINPTAIDYNFSVDFSAFQNNGALTINGRTVDLSNAEKKNHLLTFALSLNKIGEWLEYLKKNDVYDNTKIIIVSDHGFGLSQFGDMIVSDSLDAERYNPLLLYKDFNSKGFNVSNEFMTNADTPTLAVAGILNNPVNPFTGKTINSNEKTLHPQLITTSKNNLLKNNHGNTFDASDGEWWSVKDNIFDVNNWQKVEVN